MYGEAAVKEATVRFWFHRFRSNLLLNVDLQKKHPIRLETLVEELKVIVEVDPTQTTSKLAAGFGVSDKIILIHLKQIGIARKMGTHGLTKAHQQTLIE